MRTLLRFLILILFFACNKKPPIEKPEKLIDETTMINILYDLSVLQAIRIANPTILEQSKLTPTSYIYTKYKIDSLQFAQNNRYYASDIELYEKMYNQVNMQLLQKKEEINTPENAAND